jgi:hypothetical protein
MILKHYELCVIQWKGTFIEFYYRDTETAHKVYRALSSAEGRLAISKSFPNIECTIEWTYPTICCTIGVSGIPSHFEEKGIDKVLFEGLGAPTEDLISSPYRPRDIDGSPKNIVYLPYAFTPLFFMHLAMLGKFKFDIFGLNLRWFVVTPSGPFKCECNLCSFPHHTNACTYLRVYH